MTMYFFHVSRNCTYEYVVFIVILISFPVCSLLLSQRGMIIPETRYAKTTANTQAMVCNDRSKSRRNKAGVHNIPILRLSSYREPQEMNDQKELTLYEILRTSEDATRSEIKSQYIMLAKRCHPDARMQMQQMENEQTIDFQIIAEAWKILKDPKSRRKYDRELKIKELAEKAERFTNRNLEQAFRAVGQVISLASSSPEEGKNDKLDYDYDDYNYMNNTTSSRSSSSIEIEDEQEVAENAAEEVITNISISTIEGTGKQDDTAVDALELTEKSIDLEERSSAELEKAKGVIEELELVKEQRLFATLQFTEFALSSDEAEQVVKRLQFDDDATFANLRSTKKAIEKEIQSLRKTESQFTEQLESYTEIDREWNKLLNKQEEAKDNLSIKKNEEIEARKALDTAQKMVVDSKNELVKVSSELNGVEMQIRKRAHEMDKVTLALSKRQERVRTVLRRKTEAMKGGMHVDYITEQDVLKLRRKEIQLLGESEQIASMVTQLQSRADKLRKRAKT